MHKFDSRSILNNAVTNDNRAIMDVRNAGAGARCLGFCDAFEMKCVLITLHSFF